MSTAAYDMEYTLPRTLSISYKTTGYYTVLITLMVCVTKSLSIAPLGWVTIFLYRIIFADILIPLAMDYSECTLFTLNPLLPLLFFPTYTN